MDAQRHARRELARVKREIERRQAGASGARGIVVPEAGCERKVLYQIAPGVGGYM
jgi:hypothetical protein